MTRKALAALGIGAACLVAFALLAVVGNKAIMHSYLAAWLMLLALPVGALPLLMALELLPVEGLAVTPALRRLAGLMPVAALAGIPVLIAAPTLYPGLGHADGGFPGIWMGTGVFVARAILILLAWTALALFFSQTPGRRRPAFAGLGLALHVVVGTLAANDWVLAVEPGFTSSAFGLLVLVAQGGMALAVAAVMVASGAKTRAMPRRLSVALLLGLAFWLFLHFTQYLVVWSANLPAEAAWYLHRSADVGLPAEIAAGLVCLLAVAALIPDRPTRSARPMAIVAGCIVVLHVGEMLWFVTPAARGHFSVTPADLLAVAGLGALGAIFLLVTRRETATKGLDHGTA